MSNERCPTCNQREQVNAGEFVDVAMSDKGLALVWSDGARTVATNRQDAVLLLTAIAMNLDALPVKP